MIGFLDCYSGISGDMLLGALVDAGVPVEHLSRTLAGLSLADDVRLEAEEVQRGGLRATKVHVQVRRDQPHRTLGEIRAMLDGAALDTPLRERSLEVLGRLAAVEGRVHGLPPDQVELH
jgi:uncharacterized protein (DUF111 family)